MILEALTSGFGRGRDLRAPLKLLRQGVTDMFEADELMDEWVRPIDAAGIDWLASPSPPRPTGKPTRRQVEAP